MLKLYAGLWTVFRSKTEVKGEPPTIGIDDKSLKKNSVTALSNINLERYCRGYAEWKAYLDPEKDLLRNETEKLDDPDLDFLGLKIEGRKKRMTLRQRRRNSNINGDSSLR